MRGEEISKSAPRSVFLFRGKLAILFKDLAKGMAGALILEDGLSTGPGANRFDAGNSLGTETEFRGTQSLFPQNAATIFNALAKLKPSNQQSSGSSGDIRDSRISTAPF